MLQHKVHVGERLSTVNYVCTRYVCFKFAHTQCDCQWISNTCPHWRHVTASSHYSDAPPLKLCCSFDAPSHTMVVEWHVMEYFTAFTTLKHCTENTRTMFNVQAISQARSQTPGAWFSPRVKCVPIGCYDATDNNWFRIAHIFPTSESDACASYGRNLTTHSKTFEMSGNAAVWTFSPLANRLVRNCVHAHVVRIKYFWPVLLLFQPT